MQKIIKSITMLFFASSFVWFFGMGYIKKASAETENLAYKININQETLAKGYTVTAFNKLKLSLVPGILEESTDVEIIELHEPLKEPWQLDRISDFFQFEFKNKTAYDNHKPFYIQFHYNTSNNAHKQVFFYDKNFESWRPLPTKDYPQEKFVRSLIHLPYARIAVFAYPNTMTIGRASWYAYKPGNFAASPDFPKGSILRVKNIANNKVIDVEINDWGPERDKHPDRAIDLEKNAFAALASLGAGMIDVEVEPLYIAPDNNGRVLGVMENGMSMEPVSTAKAGIILNENNGEVYWSKNATSVLPLASLSKMVAVKVFLETKPLLTQVVEYRDGDADYNYQYVKEWESSRLRLLDGDKLTIKDLLYSSIVGSTNNTIETLVRVSGLPRDEFIEEMNKKVRFWGASSTHFIEPTGLSPENVSSAQDYAIITREVFKDKLIQQASAATEYIFDLINREKTVKIRNTNNIIKTYQFNIIGSKTGYLDEAGYCLMTRVKGSNNQNIIVVTFGIDTRENSFYENTKLIEYGLRKL